MKSSCDKEHKELHNQHERKEPIHFTPKNKTPYNEQSSSNTQSSYQLDCTSFTPVELANQSCFFSNRNCTPRHKNAFYAVLPEVNNLKPEKS